MRGFILAAGFGTRLKPITDSVPKALVPVCGEPLLAHSLRRMRKSGIFSAIGVNSHYLHEQMERYQRESPVPFELFYEKDRIRGTGGALDFAREFLGGDDSFMVANVDILHRFDLAGLSSLFMGSGRICALVSVPVDTGGTVLYDGVTGDFMGVRADRDAVLSAATAKSVIVREAEFTGVAFYRREVLDFVGGDDFSVIPVWKRLLGRGGRCAPCVLVPDGASSWWADIGTHAALAAVQADVDNGKVDLWE